VVVVCLSVQVMDVRRMESVDAGSYDAVIDKGTLDAMVTGDTPEVRADTGAMFQHIARILAPGGLYMTVTLAQGHLLRWWLTAHAVRGACGDVATSYTWLHVAPFADCDWSSAQCPFVLTAKRGTPAAATSAPEGKPTPVPVHLFARPSFQRPHDGPAPKRKAGGGKRGAAAAPSTVVAAAASLTAALAAAAQAPDPEGGRWNREVAIAAAADVDTALTEVAEVQWTYTTEQITSAVSPGNYVQLDVYAPPGGFMLAPAGARLPHAVGTESGAVDAVGPRFGIALCDVSLAQTAAVVLVPQGREHEWMFASEDGHKKLAATAGKFGRLLVVTLGRGHAFTTLKAVQAELSPLIVRLLPQELRSTAGGAAHVPYLAVADDIGHRDVVASGVSPISGGWVVEDVALPATEGDSDASMASLPRPPPGTTRCLRRLVFHSNRNAIQSEAVVDVAVTAAVKAGDKPGRKRAAAPDAPSAAGSGGRALAASAGSPSATGRTLHAVHHVALRLEYQQAMVAACMWAASALASPASRAVVVGVGGGCLPSFLALAFPQVWLRMLTPRTDGNHVRTAPLPPP